MASGIHWRFWQREKSDCGAIEPLLSLYADGMASAAEVRRVDAHLSDCAQCRQSLQWMQATHQVIACRPVATPPADLRARVAQAIAEAELARSPVAVRPAARPPRRRMVLRPALAYGLSMALFAAVSGTLYWSDQHSHSGTIQVQPAPHPHLVASSRTPKSRARLPQAGSHALLPPGSVLHTPPQSVTLAAQPSPKLRHLPTVHVPASGAPSEQVIASRQESQVTPPHLALFGPVHVPTPHTHSMVPKRLGAEGGLLAELPKARKSLPMPLPQTVTPQPLPAHTQLANVPPPQAPPNVPARPEVAVGPPAVTPDQNRVASYVPPPSLNQTLHRMVAANLAEMASAPLRARSVILNEKNAVATEAADVTSSSSGTVPFTEGPIH